MICSDVNFLVWSKFKGYDLIVGSPPCRDFTKLPDKHWKVKKDPQQGLKAIYSFLGFIHDAQPGYWLMENVPNLAQYIGEPVVRARFTKGMIRGFWGQFPPFLIPRSTKQNIWDVSGKYRSWIRAKIPLGVGRALGRAISQT